MIGIKLDRPLVVLDTETTGVDKDIDRIVQIGIVRIEVDGEPSAKLSLLVNPQCPIPPEATAIHGITDADVADAPDFRTRWLDLCRFVKDADFCAYNAPFDLGMLEAECKRARLPVYKPERVIDPLVIFRENVPHTLSGAVAHYIRRGHAEAHDALGDCLATLEVLQAQAAYLAADSIDTLVAESVPEPNDRFCDSGRWFYWRFNRPTFAFGKHKGTAINMVDAGYLRWMLGQELPEDTKALAKRALAGESCKREEPAEV